VSASTLARFCDRRTAQTEGPHDAFSLVLRLHRALMAAPVWIGMGVLLTGGMSSLRSAAQFRCRISALAVHSLNDQGDLQCRGRIGEVFCGFL
jgi:hypothetical protein